MDKILLVEDDTMIAAGIVNDLSEYGCYAILTVSTVQQALAAATVPFDAILLDIMLPDGNGMKLCSQLNQMQRCPIIFISCLDDSSTIIEALGCGGDDYVCKPFDNGVLHARIQANLRRVKMEQGHVMQKKLECERFSLDSDTHILTIDGQEIFLISMEFRILAFLMQNVGKYFKSRELYAQIWGQDSQGDVRTVQVHIHNLRKKMGDDYAEPRYIKNVRGKGYTFDPPKN